MRGSSVRSVTTDVPSKYNQNWSDRSFPDEPLETILRFPLCIFQRLAANLQEIFTPGHRRCDLLGSVNDGPSHLLGEFPGQYIPPVVEELQRSSDNGPSLPQRHGPESRQGVGRHARQQRNLRLGQPVSRHHGLVRRRRNRREHVRSRHDDDDDDDE